MPRWRKGEKTITRLLDKQHLQRVIADQVTAQALVTMAEPARKAAMDRYEREADPDGTLEPAEGTRRAEQAMKVPWRASPSSRRRPGASGCRERLRMVSPAPGPGAATAGSVPHGIATDAVPWAEAKEDDPGDPAADGADDVAVEGPVISDDKPDEESDGDDRGSDDRPRPAQSRLLIGAFPPPPHDLPIFADAVAEHEAFVGLPGPGVAAGEAPLVGEGVPEDMRAGAGPERRRPHPASGPSDRCR
jgi:hypothetical protein